MSRWGGLRLLAIVPILAATLTVAGDDNGYRLTSAENPVFQLGPESRLGDAVCARTTGPASLPASDHWTYRATSSKSSGLVLTDVRLGPRLMADAIGVAYVRIRTAGGLHTGFLTPTPQTQPDHLVTSRLAGPVDCAPVDGDAAVTATYLVTVGAPRGGVDVTVLVEQQYRFSEVLDGQCEPTLKSRCQRFWPTARWAVPPGDSAKVTSVSVVQRFAWNPDDGIHQSGDRSTRSSAGGVDLIKDVVEVPSGIVVNSLTDIDLRPTTLSGGSGHYPRGGAMKVIDNGRVPRSGWENYHQTSRHHMGFPSPVSPGCSECVHVHWSWFADPRPVALFSEVAVRRAVNQLACVCGSADFSDGGPQIPEGSRQTACIGWTTRTLSEPVDWCRPGEKEDLDAAKPPVMYWDATSKAADRIAGGVRIGATTYATGDAYWQKLPDRRHGGDGSFFFVPARRLATPRTASGKATIARIDPVWPAVRTTEGFPAARWVLPVRISLSRNDDQGPYHLRVKSRGARLMNADSRGVVNPGDPEWVTIRNDTIDDDGRISHHPGGWIVQSYDGKPMAAVLVFDREPTPQDVSLRLDAAPDGIPGYVPSNGTWPDATKVSETAGTIDWLAIVRRHLTDCGGDPENAEVTLAEDFPPATHDVNGDGADDVFVGAKCRPAGHGALLYAFDGASDSRDPTMLDVVDGRAHPVFDLTGGTLAASGDTITVGGTNPRDLDGDLPYRGIELTLRWRDRLELTRVDAEDCAWPVFHSSPDDPEKVCH